MNGRYKIRPLLIFSGEYTLDNNLDREGVKNTARLIKQAFFSLPGLGINENDGAIIENMEYVPACEEIGKFIRSINSEKEIALIYYCGHGFPEYEQRTVHLAFSDTTRETADMCGYDAKKLIKLIKDCNIKRYIIILDCCHSGFLCDMGSGRNDIVQLDPYETEGYVHLVSARSDELCRQMTIEGKYYIPFSYWLAKVLTGELKISGYVSLKDIYKVIYDNLKSLEAYGARCGIQCSNSLDEAKVFCIKQMEYSNREYEGFQFSSYFPMNNLKVLLVKTSIKYPIKNDDFGIPLGLWMLKGYLSTTGHNFDIEIYDERLELQKCGDNEEGRKRVLVQFEEIVQQYDVIGISLCTSEVFPAIEKFRIAKKHGKVTFAGGIFAASNEDFLLKTEVIDYVIPGVGTVPLGELLSRLYKDKQQNRLGKYTITAFGVASKGLSGFDSAWGPSQLPSMRKSMWIEIFRKYGEYIGDRIDVYTARGCENNCLFCSVQRESRQIVYRKSEAAVIDEINYLKKKGIKYFSFKDEDFLSKPNRMLTILSALKGEAIKFKIRARYDEMATGGITLQQLQELGVDEIQYGIESPNSLIRRTVNKGDHQVVNANDNNLVNFIKSHANYNITANCSLILGINNEDTHYYDELLAFVKEIYNDESKPKVYINFLTPHPYNSKFPLLNYTLVSKDLNYFTHKFPVCFAAIAGRPIRSKMLSTYDEIVKYTSSEIYNPLTKNIPSELITAFLRGESCGNTDLEIY